MAIDVDKLLAEISPDAPCGEDLSYDPALLELERIAQGTPEQQVGETIVPAEEPNWRDVRGQALALLERTRSLNVIKYLVVSMMKTEGLAGLASSLAVLRGSVERYWDTVWPQLDPDDGNDPLERMNIISFLSPPAGIYGDPLGFLQRLGEVPLCNSRQLGRFALRDIQIARKELSVPAGKPAPELSAIEAAFRDTSPEDIGAAASAARQAAEHIGAIDSLVTQRVGAGKAVNLDPAKKAMKEICSCIANFAGGLAGAQAVADDAQAPAGAAGTSASTGGGPAIAGEIRSADDVVRVLDLICAYYKRVEPSSPVPLLLRRARGLVRKSFMEIIQDLNPEALHQIQVISGSLGDGPQSPQ
jgi:type VI secretion system protein ImpA